MKRPERPTNGDAKKAIAAARRQQALARANSADVDAVAMAADMLSRRSDRFVRQVEQAFRRPA